jgi:tryptophanyl-tRNA synthetase
VHRVLAENIACGLDPEKAVLYCQSQVLETSELYLYLNMLAYKGELEKTATFKEKVRLQPTMRMQVCSLIPFYRLQILFFIVHH